MSPRLRVLVGTSPDTMVPITSIVNTPKAYTIHSDLFQGQIVANIKGLTDEYGRVRDSEYFRREERQGITWSIQVQGRFLVPTSANDILFGNTFDRPLKLPWGTSAILKFMHYIDPTLEHDLLSSTKPWALSPLICTMPHFMHTRVPCAAADPQPSTNRTRAKNDLKTCQLPPFPPTQSIRDSTDELYLTVVHTSSSGSSSLASSLSSGRSGSIPSSLSSRKSAKGRSLRIKDAVKKVGKRWREPSVEADEVRNFGGAEQRRSYFSSDTKRQDVQFGPMDVITTDFCYGFINFSPSLSLQLPGGLSLDLVKYWNGQPVRFVCCERKGVGPGDSAGEPWGRVFWCVAIELLPTTSGLMDSNIRKNPSARTNKFLSSLKAIVTRKSKDDNAVVNDNHPYSHRDGKPYMSQPVLALSHPIQSDIDADDASDHSDRSSPSTINKYPQLPHARAVSTGGLSFHDVMVKAQHNRHTSVTTTIETSRPSVPNSLRPGSLTGLPPPSTLSKGSEAFVPNSSKPGEIRGLVKPSLLKPSRPKTPVSKLLPPIPTIPLSLSYSSSEGDTITSSVQVATGTPNPYMSADRPVLITYSSTPTLPATVTGDRHNGVRSAERANNIPPVLEGDFSTERVYPKLTVNTMLDIKCNDATNNSSTINTASSQQPNFTPIQPRRTVSSAPRLSLPPANYRFSLNLVDGYSARLSPSVILRPPPLPLLNLPMLSGSTGPASSRRSKRAGLMSMPALPRHGSTMARDEEFDDVEEGEDGEDGDQEDGDGVDDDDHISPDSAPLEDEVESGYNSTSDTIHSGPSGSRSPSTCSYETPQARSSTPDEGPGYFGDLSKPAEKRFSRSPYLPPVDMSRIDMSFLDAPPLDIKGKGKSRGSTEDAGRTPIATKKPNRHGSTTPTAFGMGFFIPEETATDTWAPSSPMIKGTSPIQTPRPGDHFNLPPLPLPPSPCPILPTSSTDNRLPVPMDTTTQFLRMHKRASRSLVDIHALEKKEKVEQMVREEENSAEEERKRRIKSMRMSMKFAADGGTFSDPRLEDGDGQLKASSPTGLSRRSHFAPNWVSDGIKNDGKDGPIKASGDASSAAANLKKTDNRISMAPAYDTIIPLRRRRSMPTFNSASTPPPPYPDLFPGQSFGVKLNQIQPRDDEGQEKLPAYSNSIYLKAIMPRKIEFSQPGVQAKDRKWKRVLCVLEGTSFKVYKPPGISAIEGWWENTVGVGDMAVQITTTSSFSSRGGGAGNTDITGEGKGHLERERMREAMLRSRLDDAILSIQGPPIPFGSSNLSSATTRSGDHASSTSTTGVRPVTKSALNLAVNLLKPSSRSHGRTISDAGQPSNTLSVHRSPRPSLNMPRDGSATPTPTVASTNTNTSASLSRSSSPMFASSSSLLTTPAPSHRSTTSTSSIGGSGGSATSRPVTNSINANYPPSFSSSKGKKKAEDSDLEPDPNSLIKKYTMQKAECGLGSDYLKRKHVIRVRLEGEQFLLQAKDVDSVIAWIEGLQSAANVAMDLDERVMPRGPLFPRRRRRRRAGDATGVQPATLRTSTANIPLDALQLAAPLVF